MPGESAAGARTYYDAAGRVIRAERYADVVITLGDDPLWPGAKRAVLHSHGQLLSTSSAVYDDAGRLVKTVYPDGTFTRTTCDVAGRRVAETDEMGLTTNFQ